MNRFVAMAAVLVSLASVGSTADHLTLLGTGAPAKFHVPVSGALSNAWTTAAFDDSGWTNVISPAGFDMPKAPIGAGGVVADSVADFSGTQGGSNWYYGYWDKGADADGTFQAWDFVAFPREAGSAVLGPNNFWDGSRWDWFNGNPPWSEMSATGGHPNHPNGGTELANAHHYIIRRWVSELTGTVRLVGNIIDGGKCGDGVDLRVWVDGVPVLGIPDVFGTNAPFAVNVEVQIGSTVDFAVGPNVANDFCDGFAFNVKVLQNTLADSVEDFSGAQGARGWTYGFYDRSADGDATYHAATDFNDTHPSLTFNGSWRLGPGDPPWTAIGQTEMNPNSGPEHWAIRRYTSSYAGRVRIGGILSIFQACGGGTRARIYVDGIPVFVRDLSGISIGYSVMANVSVGSKIDFALDPMGDDACDSTAWTAIIQPAAVTAGLRADSATEFSGTQGQDNWYYGYYNKTADGDATYDPSTDFNTTDPDWTFGGAWSLGPGDPPWSSLGAVDIHPNGINNGAEHWVIRRWISEVTGALTVDWHFSKSHPDGDGASLMVFHNGEQVDGASVAGDDLVGVMRALTLIVKTGDRIDFAQTPIGPTGNPGDAADGSQFNARVYAHGYNPGGICTPVTDSQADWSHAGRQGERGWSYGYFNKTADSSASYQTPDFTTFPAPFLRVIVNPSTADFWDGTRWRWQPPIVPWDTIGQTEVQPTGINNASEHWVVRRWASTSAGELRVDWFTRKVNPFGSGVTGKLFHNGIEKDSVTIGGGDSVGFSRSLTLEGVHVGDAIDLALTPIGIGGATDDGGDGSANGMTIFTCTNVSDCITSDVLAQMKNVNASAYLRVAFNSPDTACLDQIRLRMKYDDGFVAYLNGVEIARRSAPTNEMMWNSRATTSRSVMEANTTEVIDITGFKGAMAEGVNLIAIHGLNGGLDDSDFLLAPEITVTILPPVILAEPRSRTNLLGATTAFEVTIRTCCPATYQWRSNGVPILGETNGTLLVNTQPASLAGYDVIVFNAAGSITSLVATLTLNHAPVALDNGLSTPVNTSILLPPRKLLNNDSDPDDDPVALVSVGSPSAQGGTALFEMGNVLYSPPDAFTGNDTFTYVISDGRGGTATGTVDVFVYSGDLPSANQVLLRSTGSGFKILFAGIPGKQYLIQRTTDLAPPASWTTIQTLTAPAHGLMDHEDVTAVPTAFYRTIAAP